MFGLLKQLFGKKTEQPAPPESSRAPAAQPPPPSAPPTAPAAALFPPPSFQKLPLPPGPQIRLPLKTLIALLPPDVAGAQPAKPKANAEVTIPKKRITDQLAFGVVRITYAELYSWATPDSLTPCAGNEESLIELPLGEILPRLAPEDFARRPDQGKTDLPEDVADLFGPKGKPKKPGHTAFKAGSLPPPKNPSSQPSSPAPKPPAPAPAPAPKVEPVESPKPPPTPAPSPAPAPSEPQTQSPPPAPEPEPQTPVPAPAPPEPEVPLKPAIPLPSPESLRPTAPSQKSAPQKPPTPPPPSQAPQKAPEPEAPLKPAVPLPSPASLRPTSEPKSTPPRPASPAPAFPLSPSPAPAPAPTAATGSRVAIPLPGLLDSWPASAQSALQSQNTAKLELHIPAADVESGLKKGRLAFPGTVLASLINPPLPSSVSQLFESAEIELPLKLVVPIFMASHKPTTKQKPIVIASNIPDFFKGKTAPPPTSPAPPSAPAATPTPAPAESQAPAKKSPTTPQEVVEQLASRKGIEGALVALEDGMVVASQLPVGFNADFVAAFLPACYQRSVELLKSLNFAETDRLTLVHEHLQIVIVPVGKTLLLVLSHKSSPPSDALLNEHVSLLVKQSSPS